ncbi:hypothetical protein BDZ91DRAFT_770777 [Kalaharituber pfeilii]|nr:hypothetical protein BDZ91DRAFT_770777 [Kalaharituber pfeilii]
MGNVSVSLASLHITNAQKRLLVKLVPNAFPCTRVLAKKDPGEEGLVEYIQSPPLLLKLVNEDELHFKFTFNMRRRGDGHVPVDTVINGLTLVVAPSQKVLDSLVTREFHANPNLHHNPNVHLVGDFSTEGSSAVQFEWTWTWKPLNGGDDKTNLGWRNTCSFVEYDRSAHKLSTLIAFSFWVQNSLRNLWPPSPMHSFDMGAPPKLRLNSVSELSRSVEKDYLETSSPTEPIQDGVVTASVKVDCQRPPESMMAEDGPLFRATIKSLEQKTGAFRSRMKKVLKRAEAAKMAQAACNEAVNAFMDALREAASSNATGIQPALDHYFDRTYKEIYKFEKQNEQNLQKLIIDPLTKLYNMDIKQAEAKKKEFEEESRDYYNFVGRYLGMRNDSLKQKKKVESDSKYQTRRRNFELKRFDYCSFMEDLHGGRKEQEVLSQLTQFADAQARSYLAAAKRVQDLMPQLEALSHEVKETDKEFQLQRTEREERRRQLEKSQKAYVEPEGVPSFLPPPTTPNLSSEGSSMTDPGKDTGSSSRAIPIGGGGGTGHSPALGSTPVGDSLSTSHSSPSNKFRGIRDLQENGIGENGEQERRKEGLLWALSRPGSHVDPKGLNKQAWHKYWVVLAGGQLCEYSNWKQKLDLHNEPINLRMASVREARSSERRFCFEVITPNYKRVYQATSEEDMNSWIAAINNALKITLEGGASVTAFDTSRIENDTAQAKSLQSVLTGRHHNTSHHHGSTSASTNSGSSLHRRTTVGARPNAAARRSSSTFADDPERLLQMVREADPSNSSCADCGSGVKTEWVSINMGIILCIECSGLHRSLGTHISKIRSLTLDTTSFTPDLVDLICQIGNRISNAVWEAKLDPSHRPDARASRETRLKFITAKYVDRAYVLPLSPTLSMHSTPEEALLDAARKNDLQLALYALALHANPNTVDPSTRVPVVYMMLQAADPAATGAGAGAAEMGLSPPPTAATSSSAGSTTGQQGGTQQVTFPLPELILQNGGEVGANGVPAGVTLSHWARQYVAQKTAKQLGTLGVTGGGSGAMGGSVGSGSGSGGGSLGLLGGHGSGGVSTEEAAEREKELKLQKRISAGGRIDRARVLERLERS